MIGFFETYLQRLLENNPGMIKLMATLPSASEKSEVISTIAPTKCTKQAMIALSKEIVITSQ